MKWPDFEMKTISTKKKMDPEIRVGDQIMVNMTNRLNKRPLDPIYEGPYMVKEQIGYSTYLVDKNGKEDRVHVSQIKPIQKHNQKIRSTPTPWKTLFMIVLFFLIAKGSTEVTPNVSIPIIWRKTEKIPISGYEHFTHFAVLKNPCDAMRDPTHTSGEFFLVNCLQYYETKIENLLKEKCAHVEKIELDGNSKALAPRREKRQAVTAITVAVTTLVSYGVAHYFQSFWQSGENKTNHECKTKSNQTKNTPQL